MIKPELQWEYGFYRRAGNGRARSLFYALLRAWRQFQVRRAWYQPREI